jgi:RNA polymerase sigma factor (sigma-70 family)
LADEQGEAASVYPMTLERLEAFYTTEYPKLVKTLVLFGATVDEAEDAAQKAMADFTKRSRTRQAPARPAAYVQRAAINYFIKERQRDRERLPRELRGGHLVIEAHFDDRLTAGEDGQYVERLLECLTPTQRKVIKLVMDGWSTREIAEELGKSAENVRQHLKNGRDLLRLHPEIIALAPKKLPDQNPAAHSGVRSTGKKARRWKGVQWTPDPRTT